MSVSNPRYQAIQNIATTKHKLDRVDFTTVHIKDLFGVNVFNEEVQRQRLPKPVFKALQKTIRQGQPLDPASADAAVPNFRSGIGHGIKGMRIGVPRVGWFDENLGVDRQTETAFNRALEMLEELGATIIEIDGKPFSHARKANQTILVCEAYAYHEKRLQQLLPVHDRSGPLLEAGLRTGPRRRPRGGRRPEQGRHRLLCKAIGRRGHQG